LEIVFKNRKVEREFNKPTLADGGLDWSKVTAIKILGVEDTHG